MEQHIHYCTTRDGVNLAYATAGAGPPLVKVANWLSHLDFDWYSPVWRHWLATLTANHFLVLKDQFACEPRGEIEVKGKGRLPTWFLTGRRM